MDCGRLGLIARAANAAQLNHWADIGKSGGACRFYQGAGHPVVVQVRRPSAGIADQENAIVAAAGMRIGDIGVRAFDSPRQVGRHEQVENAIDRICGHPLAPRLRDGFGNVIGRSRARLRSKGGKDFLAHPGPLLSGIDQSLGSLCHQALPGRFMVMVMVRGGHGPNIVGEQPLRKL